MDNDFDFVQVVLLSTLIMCEQHGCIASTLLESQANVLDPADGLKGTPRNSTLQHKTCRTRLAIMAQSRLLCHVLRYKSSNTAAAKSKAMDLC